MNFQTLARLLVISLSLGVSGCGIYLHRGEGEYTFIGPGALGVAERCSPLWRKGW